jgi:dihydrofolate reductase
MIGVAMKVIAVENVTLDGVAQAPGSADEDTREGFKFEGWATSYGDEVLGSFMGQQMGKGGSMLFGRRTYEQFYGYWPHQTDNPFTEALNNATKYVASTTLHEPLPWSNSILLAGDAAKAVAELKAVEGPDLVILGSLNLVQSLLRRNLIDEFVLTIYPLVLGAGRRLFASDGADATFDLVTTKPTTTGVIIAHYQRHTEAAPA